MRRFLFALLSVSLSIVPGVSLAATSGNPAPAMMVPSRTVVKTCLRAYVLHAAFDATQLHTLGAAGATPANVNDVPLSLVGSYKYSDHIGCFYKSAKGDIFNLVYNYPCVNPSPAGPPNEYRCKS